jgi:hypothetical protein
MPQVALHFIQSTKRTNQHTTGSITTTARARRAATYRPARRRHGNWWLSGCAMIAKNGTSKGASHLAHGCGLTCLWRPIAASSLVGGKSSPTKARESIRPQFPTISAVQRPEGHSPVQPRGRAIPLTMRSFEPNRRFCKAVSTPRPRMTRMFQLRLRAA